MTGGEDDDRSSLARFSLPVPTFSSALPYGLSSVAACASVSATSVWSNGSSDASDSSQSTVDSTFDSVPTSSSSQTSVDSASSAGRGCLSCSSQQSVEAKLAGALSWQRQQLLQQQSLRAQAAAPPSLAANPAQPAPPPPAQARQHPRRSSTTSSTASSAPPSLVRQSERRATFVDHLVDASTQIVQAIWPLSSVVGRSETSNCGSRGNNSYLLPLRTFIQETLRRSRASYSTLQVALYYLLLIKPRLPRHNFTMEQPADSHAYRALQCGRRMFLAALILASKYLQDRNYSARAWSKISGLSTSEINQNETAFLHAVNWRLHITNEVYNRWIDCVNRFNSPHPPPSPGPAVTECFERKCLEFRLFIQKLSPDLDNVDDLARPCVPAVPEIVRRSSPCQMLAGPGPLSPVSLCSSPEAMVSSPLSTISASAPPEAVARPVLSRSKHSLSGGLAPAVMEPSPLAPSAPTAPGRAVPAMGLLPTPKLPPPQSGSFGVTGAPAAAAGTQQILAGGGSSNSCNSRPLAMCYAVAQASNASASQFLDRWPPLTLPVPSSGQPLTSVSPLGGGLARRSSLANSVSSASSPESMISDSSRVSRASSVCSAWSMMNAPAAQLPKLLDGTQARQLRRQSSASSLRGKDYSLRPTVIPAVVPEDYEDGDCCSTIFASPEPTTLYTTGALGCNKDVPLPQREMDAADAACALAALQQQQYCGSADTKAPAAPAAGLKRSRPLSLETSTLQDNVRGLLRRELSGMAETTATSSGLEAMVQSAAGAAATTRTDGAVENEEAAAVRAAALTGSRKRLCRSVAEGPVPSAPSFPYGVGLQHPSMSGFYGPGMWQGILN